MSENGKKKFAAHVLLFNTDHFILRMIENCGPYVEKIYVAYSEFPWTYNPNARKNFKNNSDKEILKQSKYYDKIELIEGKWDLDEDQRNSCLFKAKEDGYDYLLIHDADEFYTFKDYEKNLKEIENNPGYDFYTTPWCTFWKNLNNCIVNKEGSQIVGHPEFAVNLKSDVQFIRARVVNSENKYQLSGLCHHLSYVLSNKQVWDKINTWGHSHQFNRHLWYITKWLLWTKYTKNLHPITPEDWTKASKFKSKLPEVLEGFKI